MKILLTGIDGYVGWPLALRLAKKLPEAKIVGVDHLGRRAWVRKSRSTSALPIQNMQVRIRQAREAGYRNITFERTDLARQNDTSALVSKVRPDLILHLASQPSAPYSELSPAHAHYTQRNNVLSTLNLLWALKEHKLVGSCTFVETTTMGIYGAPEMPLPEGFFEVTWKGGTDRLPFPTLASSWYHISKGHDFNNLYLAHRQWKLPIVDMRTAIVYGADTEETRQDERLSTRFDFDFCFGIVIHRFCAMAVIGHPITIYGTGERGKPFISLEDCVESLARVAVSPPESGFHVMNQFTSVKTITEVARAVESACAGLHLPCEMKWIENPRTEKETHKMEIEAPAFSKLLGTPRQSLDSGLNEILTKLIPRRAVIEKHRAAILPRR